MTALMYSGVAGCGAPILHCGSYATMDRSAGASDCAPVERGVYLRGTVRYRFLSGALLQLWDMRTSVAVRWHIPPLSPGGPPHFKLSDTKVMATSS
jgi:hypothetical protein